MALTVFRRPPRREPPAMPAGALEVHGPPPIPEKVSGGMADWMMVLPMLGGVGSMAFMFAGSGGKGTNIASSVMFGMSSLGMGAAGLGRLSGGERKKRLSAERRDYMRHLSQLRRRARAATVEQREALTWLHPEPFGLLSLAATDRLWERRPYDDDFGTVRVGTGAQQLALELKLPESQPLEDVEVLSASALRRFTRVNGVVDDLPVALAMRSFARVYLEGTEASRRTVMRAALAQCLAWHAPTELRIALCVDEAGAAEWDWLKWVPHAQHPTRLDASGPRCLVANSLADLEDLIADDLAGRPWFARDLDPLVDRAHIVVVIDGGERSDEGQLSAGGLQGVTVFDLTSALSSSPEVPSIRLRTDGQDLVAVDVDRIGQEILTPVAEHDRMSRSEAVELARVIAPVRMPADGDDDQPLTTSTGLTDLLGVSDARTLDPEVSWRPRAPRDKLKVAIGVGANGAPVELDLKEAAQGGMGPHGLLIGATGSGKSELLRTLVLGLAITHSPEALNFILVDFKGGATFTRLDRLPHTSAVITNLADELTLVDRMQDAITGEVNRRQEMLRAAGNFASLRDYDAARSAGAPLPPLPTLFIVVDEFSELLSAKPDFIDLFVAIGRVGRSLGVHLLLASQRLEEGRLRGLDTYLSYRIGLKTFSAAESRTVLGVPDAFELPTSPGNGYLKYDSTQMVRFKAAYVSGPYRASGVTAADEGGLLRWSPYRLANAITEPRPDAIEASDGETVRSSGPAVASVLDVVIGRLAGHGPPPRQVWLPPLDVAPSLDQLLPALLSGPNGLQPAAPPRGPLVVPVGVVDRPYDQRRDPLEFDLAGSAGHTAVIGGPQSGKSTSLRTIISALALTNTPAQAQFYCLDFGGGVLSSLSALPHVGVVANRLNRELVERTVNQIARLLDRREISFVTDGIDSVAQWRQRRATGEIADDGYGDVFLVIDGYGVLREKYDDLEPIVTSIAARGLNFGVHVVLASNRWAEVRPALRDLIGTRVELRLGDPSDSEVGARKSALVPAGAPGRGINRTGEQILMAAARIDGLDDPATLAAGSLDLVSRVVAAWTGGPATPVRLLPPVLTPTETSAAIALTNRPAQPGVLLGLDEDYQPFWWDPDEDQHLVIIGDSQTGKTTIIETLMRGLPGVTDPDHAQLVILDPRRALPDVLDRAWLADSAVVATAGEAMFRGAAEALAQRIPGDDITPTQLRERSWWSGPHMYAIVDNYELAGASNPLAPLVNLLPFARDIGLHIIVSRSGRGVGRAMYDPTFAGLRDGGAPFLVMDVPPDELPIVGTRRKLPRLPAGRGRWVSRRRGEFMLQITEPVVGAEVPVHG